MPLSCSPLSLLRKLGSCSPGLTILANEYCSNSALYVSSRTLFFLARKSSVERIRNTIGRTNHGHTPLTAILVSFIPGTLAFLVVGAHKVSFQEVVNQPWAFRTELIFS